MHTHCLNHTSHLILTCDIEIKHLLVQPQNPLLLNYYLITLKFLQRTLCLKPNIPTPDYLSDVAVAKFKDMIPEALNSILCSDRMDDSFAISTSSFIVHLVDGVTGTLQMILDSTAPLKKIIKQMV